MVKGYVTNNTGKSKHIFKRTVYPGQKISLELVYQAFGSNAPEDHKFVNWLESYLPNGWEVVVEGYSEQLVAVPVVVQEAMPDVTITHRMKEDNNGPLVVEVVQEETEQELDLAYAPICTLEKLSARDIYNLKMKDNPKRVIKNITSVHKLRRAYTMCRNDSRKGMLAKILQHRIKELVGSM